MFFSKSQKPQNHNHTNHGVVWLISKLTIWVLVLSGLDSFDWAFLLFKLVISARRRKLSLDRVVNDAGSVRCNCLRGQIVHWGCSELGYQALIIHMIKSSSVVKTKVRNKCMAAEHSKLTTWLHLVKVGVIVFHRRCGHQ